MKTIWLVIPCYNEEEVISDSASRLKVIMYDFINQRKISADSKIAFVNDGSRDSTWSYIEKLYQSDQIFVGINLSRNKGHQNALLAGLSIAKKYADAAITLDADLQDDISVIEKFIDQFEDGYDIVYGVRSERKTDTFFKRFTATSFYRLMKCLGVDIVYNHADFRLMSRRAIIELEQFKEVNIFLRGMVPLIGFPSTQVEYVRQERKAGKTKYPLRKMLSFAIEGITSFSIKPIRLIASLGVIVFGISLVMIIYFIVQHFTGHTISGWSSLIVSIWALGGLQLLAIGIVGEYIGKTYLETKKRPRFIIESVLHNEGEGKEND
jgi:polyisoprenyl-phosphate glycosyltransferase